MNSLPMDFPALGAQWDPDKNGELRAEDFTRTSRQKVWWRCEKGHSWQAAIFSRANGAGCPVCANRVIIPGENDLATLRPEIAAQWDGEKNAPLTPREVAVGHAKKVWWRCEKGHSWAAPVKTRTGRNMGCPICSNYRVLPGYNDLATRNPAVAAQWDGEKNGGLTPRDVVAETVRTVWWKCAAGHSWRARVYDRVNHGAGCPVCSNRRVQAGENDLATTHPELARQWHPALNGALEPRDVTYGAARKVWWLCPQGHAWRASVAARTNAKRPTGCPVCAGRPQRTVPPELEW